MHQPERNQRPFLLKGDYVWIEPEKPGEFAVSIGAKVVTSTSGRIQLVDDDGREKWVDGTIKLRHMHVSSVDGVDDMIGLGDLHESGILRNLFIRYMDHNIYTYTGSILVAVNPYEILPIYTPEKIQQYRDKKIGELPPHIFAIADNSYSSMIRYQHDQCVIISGESGAGKTESTKLILQFLAAVSGQHSWIEQQILEANPIMEAFGNAKTIRNDNSSRFGKYIDIHFSNKGVIEGAKIEQYLLEKSRIVGQMHDERNYHIFYCMLAGMSKEEKAKLELQDAHYYNYLIQGGSVVCESRNDNTDFKAIKSAMKVLVFDDSDIWEILKILASLLHLGNVKYNEIEVDHIEATEIQDISYINKVARQLDMNAQALVDALTTRTIVTREEKVNFTMNKEQSLDVRDAFVKGIYGRLFIWIVDKINKAIFKPKDNQYRKSIGVLDIFGFENFDHNSFEQLCINYANENLQQFFVRHIFKLEQAEYNLEGINWQHIEFLDNQDSLDLIAAKPMNVLALIDEESMFPKGTDQSMLNKLHQHHANHPQYLKPKSAVSHMFGIDHFAGVVLYDCRGFLEKNRDTFSADLISVIQSCKNKFLKVLFSADISVGQRKKSPTLATQFKKSLEQLMATLSNCQPFFVRCIKPNEFKKPLMFERSLCCKQLRYSGMMETIRIRRAGYPIRHEFAKFVDRYRLLVSGIGPSHKEDCRAASSKICSTILKNADYQLGRTKVFLKDAQDVYLEQQRDVTLAGKIMIIQNMVRSWHYRRRFLKMRKYIVTVQSVIRAFQERNRYIVMKQGYMRLQAMIRTRFLTARFNIIRGWAVNVQSVCRGYLTRKWIRNKPRAILQLQTAIKTIIAQGQLKKLKTARIKDVLLKEAQNFRDEEEAKLRRTVNAAEARAIAERHYQERLQDIEKEVNKKLQHWNYTPDLPDYNKQRADLPVKNDPGVTYSDEASVITSIDEILKLELPPRADHVRPPGLSSVNVPVTPRKTSEYAFAKFAKSHFMNNASHAHIRRILKQPLLHHNSEGDQLAALAVWIVILRFMADLPEPRYLISERKDSVPVMTKIYSTLGRKFSKKDLEEAMRMGEEMEKDLLNPGNTQIPMKKSAHKKIVSLTLKKKSKITEDVANSLQQGYEGEADRGGNVLLEDRPMSNLDKLHFIIGHGILRPELRDEIYCQICKQLTNNNTTHARGWILLCLCLCCFPPSKEFSPYLQNFIEEGPAGYAPYCLKRLERTEKNGPRSQPPSWLELEAAKSKEDITLTITFMDTSTRVISADSATTAKELCEQLSQEIGLKDQFGFSLYIALFDKVSSLGSRGDHVMDAISQCEQYAKEQGSQERNAPWKLFFRKEIFAPWHDPSEDPVANNLIFQQVVRGIKFGEYRCDKDDDLAMIAAQQYYIEHRLRIDVQRLQTLLSSYIPDSSLQKASALQFWVNAVRDKLQGPYFQNSKIEPSKVKEDVVNYAKYKWPLLFSRFFEAHRFSGPNLPKNDIIIAVNWTGVYIIDDQEQVLLELSYPEIRKVNSSRTGKIHGQSFNLATVRGDEYVFTSPNAEDIMELTLLFLDGLKKRSKYAIAIEDFSREGESFLAVKKGDLISLHSIISGEPCRGYGWCLGENLNSKRKGDFPAECVYVLPTTTRPPTEILNLFLSGTASKQLLPDANQVEAVQLHLHTLEQFSYDHFRPPPKRTLSKTLNMARNRRNDELWRYSREPLKQPLLKKLIGQEQQCAEACSCFLNILKYMGDHPVRKSRTTNELTDQIFAAPLNQEIMRDEIYCQIMKQLTDNTNSVSEERGWELMWLATGCFPPSTSLLKELTAFLRTRSHVDIASDILNRLQRCLRYGARKYPPHQVEVEAIQRRTTHILHKIYFPDDSEEGFDVDASTKAKDFCQNIVNKLGLKFAEGFSLFVKIVDKVISVPDEDFFFDFVRQITDWVQKSRPVKEGAPPIVSYQIFFMKKLWLRTVPGKDIQADVIFHYHQELPKYLRGYHKCTKEEAARLGALIYRVMHGDNKNALNRIPEMLQLLVPLDMVKVQSADEWKKAIMSAYSEDTGKSITDAKVSFLKLIYQWPMFGSAFFEVKQMTEPKYPENLLIAINKNGINIIHPHTKELLNTHPFSSISNWSSGNTYFHMSIGNLVKGSKLLCETSMGYKMDELLTSYISLMLTSLNRSRRGQRI